MPGAARQSDANRGIRAAVAERAEQVAHFDVALGLAHEDDRRLRIDLVEHAAQA